MAFSTFPPWSAASLNYHSLLLVVLTRPFLSFPLFTSRPRDMPSVSNPFPLFAALITRQRSFVGDIVRWKTFKIDSLGDKNGRTKREVRIEIFQFARWRIFLFQYFIFRQRFNLESKLISMMREFSLSLFSFFFEKEKINTRVGELRY